MALIKVLSLGHRFSSLEIEREVLMGISEVLDGNLLNELQLANALSEVQAVLLGTRAELRAPAIKKMKNCRLIVRYGVGLDNVDVNQANEQKIPVANVPDYCVDEVSDHTIALIMAINRRLFVSNKEVLSGGWGTEVMKGVERLSTQTIGLIGFGRIGQAVARKGKNLVRKILAFDPVTEPAVMKRIGVESADLLSVVGSSDFVSIHSPLLPETRNLFNQKIFSKMKPTAWIINTARGEILDEEALLDALRHGVIGGAALDVLSSEPPDPKSPLLNLENVLITPHVAFYSKNALEDLQRHAAQQVLMVLTGKSPRWLITESGEK